MNLMTLSLIAMGACLAVNIVASILIIGEVRVRGIKIHWLWLRILIIKYVHQYRKLTLAETGRIGPLFPLWIVSINGMALFAIGALLLKYMT